MTTDDREAVMQRCPREPKPRAADEKTMLLAFLDWQRQTLLCKLDGLSDAELRATPTVSRASLLALLKHLTAVERSWFRVRFAGEAIPPVFDGTAATRDSYWQVGDNETLETLLAAYLDETGHASAIVRRHDLDETARRPKPGQEGQTLRWIVLHMIEETARHLGHADLIREAIDGQVGE